MTRDARATIPLAVALADLWRNPFLRWATGLVGISLFISACESAAIVPTPQSSDSTPFAPSQIQTATQPPSSIAAPEVNASDVITLTVWAPEEWAPEAARGGQILQQQIERFTQSHPGLRVIYFPKARTGRGGLLDFLLQVESLVPIRMPDIVIIDSREMDAAAKAQLLKPLDHLLPSGSYEDLFPPTRALAKYEGSWLGMPLTIDLEHLAYNSKSLRTPPSTWDQLVASGSSFAFAADGDDPFLFQYMENHGRLTAGRQSVALDVPVTTSVLGFFQRARSANLVPETTLGLRSANEIWRLFAEGQTTLAEVSAGDYLADASLVPNSRFAALPTRDGAASALVSAWNFAITSRDDRKLNAAAEFVNWMTEPSRLASWAFSAKMIPARRSAFAFAVGPADYAAFLTGLLDNGMAAPSFTDRAPNVAAWRSAVQSVLRGQSTPAEAALRAAQTVAP